MLTFYILPQHKTIQTDINSQRILMCPNYTFRWKIIPTWKILRLTRLPPKLLCPIYVWCIHSPREPKRAQEVDTIHGAGCVHTLVAITFPTSSAALQDTCKIELTQGSNASFQSRLRFSSFSRVGCTFCSTKKNCGEQKLIPPSYGL